MISEKYSLEITKSLLHEAISTEFQVKKLLEEALEFDAIDLAKNNSKAIIRVLKSLSFNSSSFTLKALIKQLNDLQEIISNFERKTHGICYTSLMIPEAHDFVK